MRERENAFFCCRKNGNQGISMRGNGNLGAYLGAQSDADQSREFSSGIWMESKEHNINVECLKKLKEESNYQKQDCLAIAWMIFKQSRTVANRKAQGID